MPVADAYREITYVPRIGVAIPLALPIPDGFDAGRPETWPPVEGRLEYVTGRLLFMPRCGAPQAKTVTDVVTELNVGVEVIPASRSGRTRRG